jgi:hypothetical protein
MNEKQDEKNENVNAAIESEMEHREVQMYNYYAEQLTESANANG